MSEEDSSLPPDVAPISYPVESDEPISLEDAAREIAQAREKALKPAAERAEPATAENESPVEGDDEPETVPVEDEEADAEAEELPPIERPKSWSKDEDAEWQSLPRAVQEKIVTRESERDLGTTRSQQKAADAEKAAQAKAAAAEQAKQTYEAKLPALMQALHNTNNTAFADIKSQDDADLLAEVDPGRWVKWKAHQDRMASVNYELQQAENGKASKHQSEWNEFRNREDALAAEKIPDLADPVKGPKLMERAGKRLADLGFKPDELQNYVVGKEKIAVFDHRFQQLLKDSLDLADIRAAGKKLAPALKVVPPVQKPGTPKPANSGTAQAIQTLEKQLESATGSRAAQISAEIYRLERKSAAR